jgi:hypothetical protein
MINTKLQNIIDTKSAIGNAIVNKGGTITSETPFYSYASEIDNITTGDTEKHVYIGEGSLNNVYRITKFIEGSSLNNYVIGNGSDIYAEPYFGEQEVSLSWANVTGTIRPNSILINFNHFNSSQNPNKLVIKDENNTIYQQAQESRNVGGLQKFINYWVVNNANNNIPIMNNTIMTRAGLETVYEFNFAENLTTGLDLLNDMFYFYRFTNATSGFIVALNESNNTYVNGPINAVGGSFDNTATANIVLKTQVDPDGLSWALVSATVNFTNTTNSINRGNGFVIEKYNGTTLDSSKILRFVNTTINNSTQIFIAGNVRRGFDAGKNGGNYVFLTHSRINAAEGINTYWFTRYTDNLSTTTNGTYTSAVNASINTFIFGNLIYDDTNQVVYVLRNSADNTTGRGIVKINARSVSFANSLTAATNLGFANLGTSFNAINDRLILRGTDLYLYNSINANAIRLRKFNTVDMSIVSNILKTQGGIGSSSIGHILDDNSIIIGSSKYNLQTLDFEHSLLFPASTSSLVYNNYFYIPYTGNNSFRKFNNNVVYSIDKWKGD